MQPRTATINRTTKETSISLTFSIDGTGKQSIDTPIGFFNHMLSAFTQHGVFDLDLKATGDLHVDQHHTIEDIGIVLGEACKKALGDKKGINRSGCFVYPMDEALAVVSLDISGRPHLQYDVTLKERMCGDFDTDVLEDFFSGFSMGLQANVVVRMPFGRSDHHKIEATFKAFAKALAEACSFHPRLAGIIPSTKGML
jgi:imidazoleglycerol-phosphate dehydratase